MVTTQEGCYLLTRESNIILLSHVHAQLFFLFNGFLVFALQLLQLDQSRCSKLLLFLQLLVHLHVLNINNKHVTHS